jgi:hypothetical protein
MSTSSRLKRRSELGKGSSGRDAFDFNLEAGMQAGMLAIIFPVAFLKQKNVHFETTVSPPLAIGFITLVVLLNT